jgi:hypothetical protein
MVARWSKKWGKEHICPLTQTRLRSGKNKDGIPYCIQTICKHRFYTKPLMEWLAKQSTCPVCRHQF